MGDNMKLIDKLRANAATGAMTVLTPDEARAIYDYIDDLHNRVEVKELKYMAVLDETYKMVQLNRALKARLGEMDGQTAKESR